MGFPRRINPQRILLLVFSISPLFFAACSTHFNETHYVGVIEKSEDGKQRKLAQFYRFRLRGESFLSDTRFESGWYDARAVESLFVENKDGRIKLSEMFSTVIPQQASPINNPSKIPGGTTDEASSENNPSSSGRSPEDAVHFHFGPEGVARVQKKDQRLILLMHNDPKAITSRISAMSNQVETAELLMAAMVTPKMQANQKKVMDATLDIDSEKSFARQLAEQYGKAGNAGLATTTPEASLKVIESIRAELGSRP